MCLSTRYGLSAPPRVLPLFFRTLPLLPLRSAPPISVHSVHSAQWTRPLLSSGGVPYWPVCHVGNASASVMRPDRASHVPKWVMTATMTRRTTRPVTRLGKGYGPSPACLELSRKRDCRHRMHLDPTIMDPMVVRWSKDSRPIRGPLS